MFDVGFWELVLIAIVVLLVVGPEKLPGVARTLGIWVGKSRRLVDSVKADIEEELRLEDAKRFVNDSRASSLDAGIEDIVSNVVTEKHVAGGGDVKRQVSRKRGARKSRKRSPKTSSSDART